MATYDELLDIATGATGDALRRKIRVATVVAADVVRLEAGTTINHANRLIWAKQVLTQPDAEAARMLWAVLTQNRTQTVATILSATDASVQAAVNNAIDLVAGV